MFVEGFTTTTTPLTKLLQKKHEFAWIEETQQSFDKLKEALTEAYVNSTKTREGVRG